MPFPASRRIMKIVIPVTILLLAAAVFVVLRATKPEVAAKPITEQAWPVSVVTAEFRPQRPVMSFEGDIVAGREGELRPLVAGRIVELHPNFRNGGRLHQGETVLRIDPFTYEAAVAERRAELAEARAKVAELEAELEAEGKNLARDREQLALARQDLDRNDKLRKAGTISDKALETARMIASEREQRVLTRQQAIARFTARLDQSRATVARLASALERAERSLAETVLTAPFDGFLYDADAALGKLVSINDRLARLIDADALEARFHVPDAQYGRLLGTALTELPTRVRWHVGGTEMTYPATIDRVDSQIKSASGGVMVYARLPKLPDDSGLRPGAFVTVEVTGAQQSGAARLPLRAVFGGDTVYVAVDGRLASRKVETVAREGAEVLVRGDLKPGEQVVTTRFPEIAPGVKVTVP